jgi:hypothetical protein
MVLKVFQIDCVANDLSDTGDWVGPGDVAVFALLEAGGDGGESFVRVTAANRVCELVKGNEESQ